MEKDKKVLYVYRTLSAFVKKDFEIIEENYTIHPLHAKGTISTIKRIFGAIGDVDLSITWFAGWHAFFLTLISRIYSKKVIVFTGGYDVALVPDINYGSRLSWWRRKISQYVLNNCDLVIAISDAAKKDTLEFTSPKQIKRLYMSVDTSVYYPSGEKEDIVVTVGNVVRENLKRKGLETFIRTAKLIPEVKFYLVGNWLDSSIDNLKSIGAENVEFTGFLPDKELISILRKSKLYAQLSGREGFGISMAEAMACGCVPIVTSRGAIPEVVGDTGFYVPFQDPAASAKAIKQALGSINGKPSPYERIKRKFNPDKRKKLILNLIDNL